MGLEFSKISSCLSCKILKSLISLFLANRKVRKIPFFLSSTYTFGQIWWQPVATGTRLYTLMFTSGALSYNLCTKIGKSSRNLEIASKIVPKLLCLEAECPKPRNTPDRNNLENLATGKVEKTKRKANPNQWKCNYSFCLFCPFDDFWVSRVPCFSTCNW